MLAGWFAAVTDSSRWHTVAVDVLLAGAFLGVLPIGVHRHVRALAAPAFAGAAAFALVGETDHEKLPIVLGIAGLAAAVTAAVARALDDGTDAAARVWITTGAGLFVLTGLATLVDVPPRVDVGAPAGARDAGRPGGAGDRGRRPRQLPHRHGPAGHHGVVRAGATAQPARPGRRTRGRGRRRGGPRRGDRHCRGRRRSSPSPPRRRRCCWHGRPPIDRIGARLLVFLAGGGLLLSARSYRHTAARQLLRLAGLACWVALAWALVPVLSDGQWLAVAVAAVALAALLVVVAVATGRGWRSAWWSRRAEVAESFCVSFAIAAVVVAAGFFRILWELTS